MKTLNTLLIACSMALALSACQTMSPTEQDASAYKASTPAKVEAADKSLCQDGDGEKCFYTGMKYFRGDGVDKNYQTAFEYNKRACELGVNYGCFGAGLAYVQGQGADKSLEKSVPYFEKSCELGAHDGCFNIAILNEQGEAGLKADKQKAFEFYKKACDMGNTQACKRFKEYTLHGFK